MERHEYQREREGKKRRAGLQSQTDKKELLSESFYSSCPAPVAFR